MQGLCRSCVEFRSSRDCLYRKLYEHLRDGHEPPRHSSARRPYPPHAPAWAALGPRTIGNQGSPADNIRVPGDAPEEPPSSGRPKRIKLRVLFAFQATVFRLCSVALPGEQVAVAVEHEAHRDVPPPDVVAGSRLVESASASLELAAGARPAVGGVAWVCQVSPEALAFSVARAEIEQLWTATGCPLPGRSRRVGSGWAKRSGAVAEDHAAITVLPGRGRRQGRAGPPSPPGNPTVGSAAPHSTARRSTARRSAVRLTGEASGPDGACPRLSDWRGVRPLLMRSVLTVGMELAPRCRAADQSCKGIASGLRF
jgi:hypothetical protein